MKKSKLQEIPSQLFKQLVEHSKTITEKAIFQNVRNENGNIFYRVISLDESKFRELMDYCKASKNFVPMNFGDFEAKSKGIGAFKDLEVTFMKPLKYYGVYGISYLYRMISKKGHLLFSIVQRDLGIEEDKDYVINAKVKKEIEYTKGGIINNINYLKVKEK